MHVGTTGGGNYGGGMTGGGNYGGGMTGGGTFSATHLSVAEASLKRSHTCFWRGVIILEFQKVPIKGERLKAIFRVNFPVLVFLNCCKLDSPS
jgi:hypothetical protein